MAAVPTALYAALNGLAAAAKTAGDPNAISLCTQMAEMASFAFGAYTAAGTSASPAIIPSEFYPVGGITPSYDSAGQVTAPGSAGSPW